MQEQFTQPPLEAEEWRPVRVAFPYEVSNLGRVRHIRRRQILRPSARRYAIVHLVNGRHVHHYQTVHTLVAEAFLPPKPTLAHQINHKDADRFNNHYRNLEWVTCRENVYHSLRLGLWNPKGATNPKAKLSEKDVRYIRDNIPHGPRGDYGQHRADELGQRFGLNPSTIRAIWAGRTWKHLP